MCVQFEGRVFWIPTMSYEGERICSGSEGRSNMRMRQRTVNRLSYTTVNLNQAGKRVGFVQWEMIEFLSRSEGKGGGWEELHNIECVLDQ